VDIVKYLIPLVYTLDDQNDYGQTPLHIAFLSNNIALATLLLEQPDSKAPDVNLTAEGNNTLAHICVQTKNMELLTLLAKSRPDLTVANSKGETPLILALSTGQYAQAQLLIDLVSSIECKDSKGNTPLHLVFELPDGILSNIRFAYTQEIDADDKLHLMEIILNKRPKFINDRNQPELRTALHVAVLKRMMDAVQLLLERDVDINVKDKAGNSVVHIAAENGFIDILVLLLNHPDVKVNEKNAKGYTPLLLASQADRAECCKLLMRAVRIFALFNNFIRVPK
jgi:ankyrin repeat protein